MSRVGEDTLEWSSDFSRGKRARGLKGGSGDNPANPELIYLWEIRARNEVIRETRPEPSIPGDASVQGKVTTYFAIHALSSSCRLRIFKYISVSDPTDVLITSLEAIYSSRWPIKSKASSPPSPSPDQQNRPELQKLLLIHFSAHPPAVSICPPRRLQLARLWARMRVRLLLLL
jgi:hypothetical protein